MISCTCFKIVYASCNAYLLVVFLPPPHLVAPSFSLSLSIYDDDEDNDVVIDEVVVPARNASIIPNNDMTNTQTHIVSMPSCISTSASLIHIYST